MSALPRFIIENVGEGAARDVQFSLVAPEGKSNPIPVSHLNKLHFSIIRPGAHQELLAAPTFGTGVDFTCTWSWIDDDDTPQERTEQVSLQQG